MALTRAEVHFVRSEPDRCVRARRAVRKATSHSGLASHVGGDVCRSRWRELCEGKAGCDPRRRQVPSQLRRGSRHDSSPWWDRPNWCVPRPKITRRGHFGLDARGSPHLGNDNEPFPRVRLSDNTTQSQSNGHIRQDFPQWRKASALAEVFDEYQACGARHAASGRPRALATQGDCRGRRRAVVRCDPWRISRFDLIVRVGPSRNTRRSGHRLWSCFPLQQSRLHSPVG